MRPEVGLLLPLLGGWEGGRSLREPSVDYAYIESCALEAEALGFHSVWLPDHLLNPFREGGVGGLEAWTTASALARATTRIKISFATLSSGFRHPALLANMGATLDRISSGRLILTLGAGWYRREYASLGFPWASHEERVRRAEEQIVLLRKLWTEPRVTFRGRYYGVREAAVETKPAQRPCPPIWYGGDSTASMSVAARVADGWVFSDCAPAEAARRVRAMRKRTGRDVPIGMMVGVWPRAAPSAAGVDGTSKPRPYLAGAGGDVAEQIAVLGRQGLSLLLLKFHPTLAQLRRFARARCCLLSSGSSRGKAGPRGSLGRCRKRREIARPDAILRRVDFPRSAFRVGVERPGQDLTYGWTW